MKCLKLFILIGTVSLFFGCVHITKKGAVMNFKDDVSFLKKHMDVIVLSDSTGQGKVCVVPALQGRVMTSSADGGKGPGYGWINYKHFEAGKLTPHINPYGGEDRFWMGPEGGQFSIFFPKDVPFKFEDWSTPKCIDTEPFDVVLKSNNSVAFKKDIKLTNYSGTDLNLRVDREVRVIDPQEAVRELGLQSDKSVNMVAYQSRNKITNTGKNVWDKKSGMLSVWILGMYNPSPATTVVIPYNPGPESGMGPVVNDNYFGKVPADRLVVKPNAIYFSGDGKYRSKIGLPPKRAKSILGSYDALNKLLTVVQYTKPEGVDDYVNSAWELQKEPFKGDTVNSYNDGPNDTGSILGPFYELESSSPAAALKPGESLTHMHRTIHFTGAENALDKVAKTVLGVSIEDIKNGLKK
jgi:hypothetical protein